MELPDGGAELGNCFAVCITLSVRDISNQKAKHLQDEYCPREGHNVIHAVVWNMCCERTDSAHLCQLDTSDEFSRHIGNTIL